MIERRAHRRAVQSLLEWNPAVAILGARQIGKTTLARQIVSRWERQSTVFDLEDPADRALLDEPRLALAPLEGLVVLDEVQILPEILEVIRVLVDRPESETRFLLLGSASPHLLKQSAETLAGRVFHYELGPLALDEVGAENLEKLWVRGGFPRSYLAETEERSALWRQGFTRTFLERDIPALGIQIPPATLDRFWSMLAHYHGDLWNGSELARAFGVTAKTVRRYLDILTSTYMIRQLQPWHENLSKRQVRSPKIYLRDSGLLHTLLRLDDHEAVLRHPKLGASWEGFALEAVVRRLGVPADRCYFWSTHQGAELDLFVMHGGRRYGFEFKRTASPSVTRSMHVAREDLGLDHLDVVHAGAKTFPLRDDIRALSLHRVLEDLKPLREPFG